MRIIARSTLEAFADQHPETGPSLHRWLTITRSAEWSNPGEVLAAFSKAKLVSADRVRFEVAGGDYRLIVAFDFRRRLAFIKFVGTHAEYDRVDAVTVAQL